MATFTLKTYKRALADVVKSDSNNAEKLQGVIELGFEEVFKTDAEGNQINNLSVLSDVVVASGTMRNKLTQVITAYIGDNIKGIVWDKDSKRYKKVKDKTVKITGSLPDTAYYEHESMHKQGNIATFDENKRFDSFWKQRGKAVAEGRIKGDNAKLIEQMKQQLAFLEAEQEALGVSEAESKAPTYNPEELADVA